MAERCPWCGKFAASWARNRHQSDWDAMNNGPEYICIACAEEGAPDDHQ
jgi:hypothetical protein